MAGQSVHAEILSPLAADEKDYLLACVMRLPEVFQAAKERVRSDYFDQATEGTYKVLWLAIEKLLKEGGTKALFSDPSKARLLIEINCKAVLEANPKLLVPEARPLLFDSSSAGLLHWCFEDTKPVDLDKDVGFEFLQRFIRERAQRLALLKLQQAGTGVLSNLPSLLKSLQNEVASADTLFDDPLSEPAPDGWLPVKLGIRPTGVPFVDKLMRGGSAPGEVYGIIGCTGVGKTTLSIQLAVEGAKQELAEEAKAAAAGKPHKRKYWYIFHYEAGKEEMRRRVMVYAACIDKDRMEDHDAVTAPLSRTDDPSTWRDYEKQLFADSIQSGTFMAERERFEEARVLLNGYIILVDMSCPPDAPRRGTGFLPEVAAIIQRGVERGKPVGGMVLDYAGVMAKRYLEARNMDASNLRHLLGTMGDATRASIADPYGCSVWIMHQLSGEANKLSPHKPQSHADAAEAKNFAENLWFAFTLGVMFQEGRCVLFHRSKSRRAGDSVPTILVRLEGEIGKFDMDTKGWSYQNGMITDAKDPSMHKSKASASHYGGPPLSTEMAPEQEKNAYE